MDIYDDLSTAKLDQKESDSMKNGKILMISQTGQPSKLTEKVWFVWFKKSDKDYYKVMLKTFNTIKANVEEDEQLLKDSGEYFEVGLGQWHMSNGKVDIFAPEQH